MSLNDKELGILEALLSDAAFVMKLRDYNPAVDSRIHVRLSIPEQIELPKLLKKISRARRIP